MATIRAKEVTASITFDIPVFIGTTGDPKGLFPEKDSHELTHVFLPIKGDFGTLVFDHAEPTRRNPLSPYLFQYWWENNKLVVREDFNSCRCKHSLGRSPGSGFSCAVFGDHPEQSRVYYTGNNADNFTGANCKTRVKVLDLLLFIEGKIGDLDLDARAIAP